MAKSKFTHDDVLDAALDAIRNNAGRMCACNALPTTYAQATTTPASSGYMLADVNITSANIQDCANGDTSGRKIQIDAQNDVDIDYTGTAGYIAIVDTSNSKILHVGTCTDLALTAGQKVNFPAWDIEFADPTGEA